LLERAARSADILIIVMHVQQNAACLAQR
jgi:hypothetical protein